MKKLYIHKSSAIEQDIKKFEAVVHAPGCKELWQCPETCACFRKRKKELDLWSALLWELSLRLTSYLEENSSMWVNEDIDEFKGLQNFIMKRLSMDTNNSEISYEDLLSDMEDCLVRTQDRVDLLRKDAIKFGFSTVVMGYHYTKYKSIAKTTTKWRDRFYTAAATASCIAYEMKQDLDKMIKLLTEKGKLDNE